MRIDEPLAQLGEFPPMPAMRDARWDPVEHDWDTEVRVIDPIPDHPTFTDDYQPAVLVDPEPEPIARLRPRDSWADMHRTAVDRLRMTISLGHSQLVDAIEGCRQFNYHTDVTDQLSKAADAAVAALRLMDIHDPE